MTTSNSELIGLNLWQTTLKRAFDILFSLLGLVVFWWVILISWFLASVDTRSNGFFLQKRVGFKGKIFRVIKIKTMRSTPFFSSNVTRLEIHE